MDENLHQDKFIEFHKKKRSYWLLVSTIVLLLSLTIFVYAFKTQSKYNFITKKTTSEKPLLNSENKERGTIIPDEINNTTLFFQKDKSIFLKSPLDSQPQKILEADVYGVSSDGKKIAFYRETPVYKSEEMLDEKGYFAILDLTTNKTEELKLQKYFTLRGIEWSPDDKKILISYGTSMYGSTYIYDLLKKAESGAFGQRNKNIWLDNENIITSGMSKTVKNRFVESGYGNDIVKISINNPESPKILLAADPRNDYYAVKVDGDCLVVKVDSVKSDKDWESADRDKKIKIAYKCFNLKDESLSEYDYDQTAEELVANNIKKELMIEDNALSNVSLIDSVVSSKYKIVSVQKTSGSIYDAEIFLVNTDNITGSLFLLGQGAEIYWRKI